MPPRIKQNDQEQRSEIQDRPNSRQKRISSDRLENCTTNTSTPVFDISTLPIVVLRRYRNVYKLQTLTKGLSDDKTFLSSGEALTNAVRRHFNALPVKEYDMIAQFLYTVKNKDKVFRKYFYDEII
ncbi:hypothetical protein PCANB_003014 [Pneumocystis canis]|nr:hypothetical protein PCANB_003014 [Pneumocystis canis]